MENNNNEYLKTKHFIGLLATLVTISLFAFNYVFVCLSAMDTKVSNATTEYAKIESRLAEIQTDLVWIKKELK